jgi:hypothetical protein
MAIGAITVGNNVGRQPSAFAEVVMLAFAGDGAYGAGGTADFEDSVRAKLGRNVTVLAVVGQDCGGYVPVYDRANDKLKVYEQTNVATSPLIETATANLSGTTFNVLVFLI